MMTCAVIAVTLATRRGGARLGALGFGLVAVVALYATVANVMAQPTGIAIALVSIAAIVVSLVSLVQRSTALRQERIEIGDTAQGFINDARARDEIHIVVHRRHPCDSAKVYEAKLPEQREDNHIPLEEPILFLEVDVEDAPEFSRTCWR
jgi:hypothetical protein